MIAQVVDITKLTIAHLRDQESVTDIVSRRLVVSTPKDISTPWVRVVKLDALSTDPADHLTDFLLQLDAYAGESGGHPEAVRLGRAVRAALGNMPGVHDGAVVTGVQIRGDNESPDTDLKPPRDHVRLTVQVWAYTSEPA